MQRAPENFKMRIEIINMIETSIQFKKSTTASMKKKQHNVWTVSYDKEGKKPWVDMDEWDKSKSWRGLGHTNAYLRFSLSFK